MKILLAALFTVSSFGVMAQTFNVEPSATKIVYVGKKVTGEHTGNLNVKSGKITLKGEEITGGEVVVDMNSLTSTDLTDAEYNAKYVGHMKSEDFFNTAKYPESKLVIKSSKKTAKGLEVKGDLTIIGQTKPVTFIVTDLKKTDAGLTGKSNLTLNRTQWGLKYGSNSFFKGLGDKAINDDFTLAIDLAAKK
ncbi:MAG: YceI family protein [Bacteriovoracaceae bacterium]|nr:YceI family protein [Bacteriovoracaceae bacterium]